MAGNVNIYPTGELNVPTYDPLTRDYQRSIIASQTYFTERSATITPPFYWGINGTALDLEMLQKLCNLEQAIAPGYETEEPHQIPDKGYELIKFADGTVNAARFDITTAAPDSTWLVGDPPFYNLGRYAWVSPAGDIGHPGFISYRSQLVEAPTLGWVGIAYILRKGTRGTVNLRGFRKADKGNRVGHRYIEQADFAYYCHYPNGNLVDFPYQHYDGIAYPVRPENAT